jgi:hypothetical protein
MTAQENILADLQALPSTALQQVADYVHQLRGRSLIERQIAFDASFGSMPKEDADAFDRAIENGCEQIDS